MPRKVLNFLRLRPSHRLMLIFAATILLPGILLGFFGLRALIQERRMADQQIRESLQAYSETVARRLELELSEWQRAPDQLIQAGSTNATLWPLRVRQAVAAPGSAVVLLRDGGRIQAWPSGQLLFLASSARPAGSASLHPSPLLAEAEALELRDKDYDQAIARYRRLLATSHPSQRAIVLHRLARSLKKAGRIQEALETFRLLEKEPRVLIGSLPSDLLALYEIWLLEEQRSNSPRQTGASFRLYHGLVNGNWQLEKPSYLFYSERVREKLPRSEETSRLELAERQKLALTVAAERFLEEPQPLLLNRETYCLALWRAEPFVAILLAEPFLRSDVWPSAFRDAQSQGFRYSLIAPGGRLLFGAPRENREPVVSRSVPRPELSLVVETWPHDLAALQEKVGLRQNLYLGMLGIVVTLLAFGGYLTVRTVRTELAMAQMKSEFVSTVSHEFRSPLAGINQLAEMLRDGRVPDEPRRQAYYEMIVNESQRLRRLIENVLDFSRMEEGRKQYRFAPFEPSPWLQQVTDEFQTEVAPAGFSVESRIPEDLPALVGDPQALATAVHNLLDNAVKYSRDSKTVWLETSANGDALTISVRDRGVGIREQDRAHVFERFYRGGELRERVKGAGLGLNLVQHIVAAHGGVVDFSSKEGEGSTFTIHLKTAK